MSHPSHLCDVCVLCECRSFFQMGCWGRALGRTAFLRLMRKLQTAVGQSSAKAKATGGDGGGGGVGNTCTAGVGAGTPAFLSSSLSVSSPHPSCPPRSLRNTHTHTHPSLLPQSLFGAHGFSFSNTVPNSCCFVTAFVSSHSLGLTQLVSPTLQGSVCRYHFTRF